MSASEIRKREGNKNLTSKSPKSFGGSTVKRILLAGLSVLMMSTTAPAVAETHTVQNGAIAQATENKAVRQLSPKELVTMAERGEFREQGIPSHGRLADAAATRRITATDLVKVAIAAEKLSPETMNDTRYLNAVANFLARLNRG
jgi:hypothetical protein